jgi:hypothetical protein
VACQRRGPDVLSAARARRVAVAIGAVDLDCRPRFAVELAVAVGVLLEVAILQCMPISRWMSRRWTAF